MTFTQYREFKKRKEALNRYELKRNRVARVIEWRLSWKEIASLLKHSVFFLNLYAHFLGRDREQARSILITSMSNIVSIYWVIFDKVIFKKGNFHNCILGTKRTISPRSHVKEDRKRMTNWVQKVEIKFLYCRTIFHASSFILILFIILIYYIFSKYFEKYCYNATRVELVFYQFFLHFFIINTILIVILYFLILGITVMKSILICRVYKIRPQTFYNQQIYLINVTKKYRIRK